MSNPCDFCQQGKTNVQEGSSLTFRPPNKIEMWSSDKRELSHKSTFVVAHCPFCGRKLKQPEESLFKNIKAPQVEFDW